MEEKCQQCEAPAACFCLCGDEDTLLCKSCYFDHFSQLTDRTHAPYHLAAYAHKSIPGYFERLQARSAALPAAKEKVRKNIESVAQCIEELRAQVETFIFTLQEFTEAKVTELQQVQVQLEADFQASVSEVQRTFYEDEPALHERFSVALRGGDDEVPFGCQVHLATPEATLQLTYTGYSPAVSEECLFALVGSTWLEFALPSGESQSTTLAAEFEAGCSVVVLEDKQALVLGDKATLLNLNTKQLAELEEPSTSRLFAGVLKYQSLIYAFGGQSPASCSCEVLDLEERSWTSLANMQQPRSAFTPCLYEESVYLADSSQTHRAIEVFDLTSKEFTALAVELPASLQGHSVSFFVGSELVLLTSEGQAGRWQLEGESWKESEGEGGWACCGPVLLECEVCWVTVEGRLLRFALESS